MPSRLTHLDPDGRLSMVDVSAKPVTARTARASARVRMSAEARAAMGSGSVAKGEVFAAARLAGINAAKHTAALIPLCHSLLLRHVAVELALTDEGVSVQTLVQAEDRTGVEMEALTAATVAALTVYDMVKAIDHSMVIEAVQLEEKTGGRSGDFRR